MRRRLLPVLFSSTAPAFAPTDIVGLSLWLDFSDITTLFQDDGLTTPVTADGQAIGGISDKSGNARNAVQATAGRRPTYKASVQNGKSIGRFSTVGGAASFDGLASTFGATLSQPNTIFVVSSIATVEGNVSYVYDGIVSGSRHAFLSNVSGTPDTYYLYAGVNLQPAVTLPKNAFKVFSTLWNTTSSQHWENGVSKFTGSVGTHTLTGLMVGAAWDYSVCLLGDIAEVLVYNANLTDANRQAVETFLNTKWTVY